MSLRAALAAALGSASVDLCQATDAAVTWLENRPCDLVAVAGQGSAVVDTVTRLRRVSRTILVLAIVPDPSAREAGAAWLSGADDVVTATALGAGTLPEGLDEVRHPERDVLRKTQRLWYAGPADPLRQQLVTRVGARFREVGLSAEGLAGLTTQDVEAPHSAALIVNAATEPDALVLGVRRVTRTYPGLAITVVAEGAHHDAFRRAGADECVGLPADADPVLHAVGRAQAACRASLELDVVRARETRLRALLEHLPEAVMLVSPDHAVLAVNLAALRLIGAQDARQVLGSALSPWLDTNDDHADGAVALVDGVSAGASRALITRTRHLADPRRLQLRAVPFQRETGGPPAALIVLREVVETPVVEAPPPVTAAEDGIADAERSAWHEERSALQERLARLESDLVSARAESLASDGLAADLATAHEELASARALAESLREALAALETTTTAATDHEQLQQRLEAWGVDVEAIPDLLAAASRLAALEQDDMPALLARAATEREAHEAQVMALREELASLQNAARRLSALEAQEVPALREAATAAAQERDRANGALTDVQGRVRELEAALSDAWSQKGALEEQLRTSAAVPASPLAGEPGVDIPAEHGWILQDADDVTWLLADASAHRLDTAEDPDRPDTVTAVLEVVAAECASIVDEAPVAFRGPRSLDAPPVSPAASHALDRAPRVLLAQVSSFRRRRAGLAAIDDLRAHLIALDPVLARLATDDVAWELSVPADAVHVGASASDMERCLMALVTTARDALPLGGRVALSVETPAAATSPGMPDVRRLDAHVVMDAQGYGVADIALPGTLRDLAASVGGVVEVVRVDALTQRVSLRVPRAFVVSHAA